MKDLVIRLQPFVFKQSIIIREGGKFSEELVPQREIASYISLCENVDTVHFFGNEKFARKIKDECICKYNVPNSKVKFVFNK